MYHCYFRQGPADGDLGVFTPLLLHYWANLMRLKEEDAQVHTDDKHIKIRFGGSRRKTKSNSGFNRTVYFSQT